MKATISKLLVLALILSFVLVAAPTAHAAGHENHCVCGGLGAIGDHTCKTEETWTELTEALCGSFLPSGNYYLADDLTITSAINLMDDATVTICLNGKKLTNTGENQRVFTLNRKKTLNICDCQKTGSINNAAPGIIKETGGLIYMSSADGQIVNLFGGTLNAPTAKAAGGAIRVGNTTGDANVVTLNMYGGTVQGGKTESMGGNISVYGEFNMYGGTVKGGSAVKNGGNIYLSTGAKVTINGGTITGGTDSHITDVSELVIGGDNASLVVKGLSAPVHVVNLKEKPVFSVDETKIVKSDFGTTSTGFPVYLLTPNQPAATGDTTNLMVLGLGLILGAAGLVFLVPKKRTV